MEEKLFSHSAPTEVLCNILKEQKKNLQNILTTFAGN